MTTTGTFTVEASNDPDFEVGASYSITATVSKTINVFGVTKVEPIVDDTADSTSEPASGGAEELSPDAGDSLSAKSTPPATP